jgi:beta-mannosidase
MMLPTSASGPNDVIYLDRPGLNHDVHGPWKFYGPQYHYDLYNGSDAILQSEFGCDGFSCYESLEKFLSPANLHVDTAYNNMVWRYHGEWWDSYGDRERPIFGDFARDDLKTLIKCNQFMQAEGIRYALEANRRRAHKNVGSIIWQFNEPWPNVFCTCIVDYYATPKLAYYAVAQAYAPRTVLLRYSNILQCAGRSMKIGVAIANDLAACDFSLKLVCEDPTGKPFYETEFSGQLAENAPCDLGEIEIAIPTEVNAGFTIKALLTAAGVDTHKTYTILTKDQDAAFYDRSIAISHYDRVMAENGR